MSDVLYPLGLIKKLDAPRIDRTIVDEFESGGESAQQLWTSKYFKRKISFTHSALTIEEFHYLRNFFAARSGRYDPFWFRDYVNRGGNAKVRFLNSVPEGRDASMAYQNIQIDLMEIAPLRILPVTDEFTPLVGGDLFYDANRAVIYLHAGTSYNEATIHNEITGGSFLSGGTLGLQGTSVLQIQGLVDSQYQAFAGSVLGYLKSTSSGSLASTDTGTWFGIVKHAASATSQVVCAFGQKAGGKAIGLLLNSSNKYTPFEGLAATAWTNAQFTNTANTWRSFAVVRDGAGNYSLYINAVLIGTDAQATNTSSAAFATLNDIDGTLPATGGQIANAIYSRNALTLANIKVLHNLFGYQYGLTTVV